MIDFFYPIEVEVLTNTEMKYWKTVYFSTFNHSIIPYDLVLYLEAKRI
jgi:hypothetical protein